MNTDIEEMDRIAFELHEAKKRKFRIICVGANRDMTEVLNDFVDDCIHLGEIPTKSFKGKTVIRRPRGDN